jgi:hypothetical protein
VQLTREPIMKHSRCTRWLGMAAGFLIGLSLATALAAAPLPAPAAQVFAALQPQALPANRLAGPPPLVLRLAALPSVTPTATATGPTASPTGPGGGPPFSVFLPQIGNEQVQ